MAQTAPLPSGYQFTATATTTLTPGTTSSRTAISSVPTALVTNQGVTPACVAFGGSSVTAIWPCANLSNSLVNPGQTLNLAVNGAGYLAGITGTGTATLSIQQGYFSPPTSGGLASTVSQGSAGSASQAWFNQLVLGGAVVSATNALPVQPGSGATFPVSGTFWQATQPISAVSLPLPSGAATQTTLAAILTALGSPMQQTGGSVSLAAALPAGSNTLGAVTQASGPWTSNITQFGGNAIATGTGVSGAGIPRVTISNDSSLAPNQSVNLSQIAGITTSTGAGAAGVGSQRVAVGQDASTIAGSAPPTAATPFDVTLALGGSLVTSGNPLPIICESGCSGGGSGGGTSLADASSFTQGTTALTPIGGIYTTSPTSLSSGQAGVARLTATRLLMGNLPDLEATLGPGAAPSDMIVSGLQYNTSPPAPSNGQTVALQGDSGGNLLVDLKTSLPAGANTIGAVTQASGPWTVSQPTAANLNATVVGAGTAGSPAGGVVSIQGVTSGQAVPVSAASLPLPSNAAQETGGNLATLAGTVSGGKVAVSGTFWQTTQPISAASLPLPTGAATAANQSSVQGTVAAGTAPSNAVMAGLVYNSAAPTPSNGQALALQGDASGNLKVDIATSATISTNVAQVNGSTVSTGAGAAGGGAQRVTVAEDTNTIAGSAPPTTSSPFDVSLVQGGAVIGALNGLYVQPGTGATFPVSAASLPLPSGAAISADQCGWESGSPCYSEGLGTAGSPSGGIFTVQGVSGGTALSVSAASLPLPSGAATAANQTDVQGVVGAGTAPASMAVAGLVYNSSPLTPSDGQSLALQGDASGYLYTDVKALPSIPAGSNTIGAVTQASGPWTENLTQIDGNAVLTGAGAVGAGSVRVAVGQDGTTIAGSSPPTTSSPFDVALVQGGAVIGSTNGLYTQPASGATFPVSAASLPLPTGASTAANQCGSSSGAPCYAEGLGTAGSPAGGIVSIQGVSGGTVVPANISQIAGGSVPSLGTGILGISPAPTAAAGAGIVPVASASAEASHVLKSSAGNFYSGSAFNATTTAGICMLINATAAPTTGSSVTPLAWSYLPASGQCSISTLGGPPAYFSTGIVFLVSSNASPFTFTSGTITAAISGMVQ